MQSEKIEWMDVVQLQDARFIDASRARKIEVLSCTRYKGHFWFIVADPKMKRSEGPDVLIVEPSEVFKVGFSCNVCGEDWECPHIEAAKAFLKENSYITES